MRTIRAYTARYVPEDLPVDARRGDLGEFRAVADWISLPDGLEGDSVSVALFHGAGTRTYTIGADGVRAWNVPEFIQTVSSTTGEGNILIGTGMVPYTTQLEPGGDGTGASHDPAEWALTTEPDDGLGATGIYVEDEFVYDSTIDTAQVDLPGKYCYDAGIAAVAGTLPVMVLLHSYSGGLPEMNDALCREFARKGFLVVAFQMRGRIDGFPDGSADDSVRELYDIYDGLVHVQGLFPVLMGDRWNAHGWSGGGGNAFALAAKFPDFFTVYTSVSGISDYGYDTSSGWWYQTQSHRAQLLTEAGSRITTGGDKNYRSRNAVEAIPFQLAGGGYLYMFHDSADGDVPSVHDDRVYAGMVAKGLTNVTQYLSHPGDPIRWLHGFIYPEQRWRIMRRALGMVSWIIPTEGEVRVIGYIKTKRFEIWLGSGDNPRTTFPGGGIGHVAHVEYDTISRVYRVTPLTGTMHVQILQTDVNGTIEVQQTITGPTDIELNALPTDILEFPQDIIGCVLNLDAGAGITLAGSDVAVWADQSTEGNDYAGATNRPAKTTVDGLDAVTFVAASSERLDGPAFVQGDQDLTLIFHMRFADGADCIPFSLGNSSFVTKDRLVFRHLATSLIGSMTDDNDVSTETGNSNSSAGVNHTYIIRRTNGRLRIQVDYNSESYVVIPEGAVINDISCLGALHGQSGYGSFSNASYFQVIAYDRSISDRDLFKIQKYLDARWVPVEPYFPATLGNLTLGLDWTQLVDTGGVVTDWPDLSAIPFTVSQGTALNRPAYVADAGDGLPCIECSGSTFLNGVGVPCGTGDYTIGILIKSDSDGPVFTVAGTGFRVVGFTRVFPTTGDSRIFDDVAGDKELVLGGLSAVTWHFLIARCNGSTMKLRAEDGADVTDVAPAGARTLTNFGIGTWPGISFFDGKIAGVWVYDEDIGDANCESLYAWVAGERSITP